MGSSDFSPLKAARGEYPQRPGSRVCADHGDYAVTEYLSGGEAIGTRPGVCPKCVESRDAAAKAQEEQAKVDLGLKNAKIPLRFASCELETYRATDANVEAFEMVQGYAARWPEQCNTGESLVMIGDVGTGKTHLAVGLLKHVVRSGKAARYCTVAELLREIRATWKGQGDRTETQMVEYFGSLPLLVLDEIGATNGTDNERVILFDVLNERYEKMLPTIVCGNVSAEELPKVLDERVVDRLRENGGRAAIFTGQSHRRAA
jgi:DNA replication protein DnaC